MGDVGSLRSVRIIVAPLGPSVFDQGMSKVAYRTPDGVESKTIWVVLETCLEGSNRLRLGMQSSEDLSKVRKERKAERRMERTCKHHGKRYLRQRKWLHLWRLIDRDREADNVGAR